MVKTAATQPFRCSTKQGKRRSSGILFLSSAADATLTFNIYESHNDLHCSVFAVYLPPFLDPA